MKYMWIERIVLLFDRKSVLIVFFLLLNSCFEVSEHVNFKHEKSSLRKELLVYWRAYMK